jgi:hypothetical protein
MEEAARWMVSLSSKTMNAKIRTLAVLCVGALGMSSGLRAEPMEHFRTSLPGHTFSFALPPEMSRALSDPQRRRLAHGTVAIDTELASTGSSDVLNHAFHFTGIFGTGPIGSFTFNVIIKKRDPQYDRPIATVEELEQYLIWWRDKSNLPTIALKYRSLKCDRSTLNGKDAVKLTWNPSSVSGKLPQDLEIYSMPLTSDLHLDCVFIVEEYEAGKAAKWKAKADAFRDAIKSSIVLSPKI